MNKLGPWLAVFLLLALAAAVVAWRHTGSTPHVDASARDTWQPPEEGPEPVGPGAGYLRGAHWFGDAWAVNFWNTRLEDRAREDFATLRADGFNTVVLVVPWPGFSPAPTDGRLDPERSRRLKNLVDLAGEAGLNVVLRLGYAWDASVPQSGRWLMQLWVDEAARRAWVRHIGAIWNAVGDRSHLRFAFISWEDLWAVTGLGAGTREERLKAARETGFQDWLARYSTLDAVNARFGERFDAFGEVPVPSRHHPAYGLFYDFIDWAWIERFFKPAQAVFPTLSMEVRIDSDPVWNAPGDLAYWHSHELAWDLPGAPWTTVYWAPAMGGENRGETLTPETAAERLAYQMERLRRVTGDRPIFIDQFLVEDFTPGFEMNGRLPRDRVGEFLEAAAPVLRRLTHGYALWTWRDYRHDAVPSPDLSVTAGNWTTERPANLDPGTNGLLPFPAGATLKRAFGIHEFHAPGGPETATFCVTATPDGDVAPDLAVRVNETGQEERLDATGSGEACTALEVTPLTTVTLRALTPVELIATRFSGFTQPTGMRDVDGRPKPVAEAWQTLNDRLVAAAPSPFERYEDGWMGKTFTRNLAAKANADAFLVIPTNLPGDWPFTPTLSVSVNGRHVGTAPCEDDALARLAVPADALEGDRHDVAITVDRSWRPPGDERRLGCLVGRVTLEPAD